jgi:hypothetical protein
MIMTSEQFNEWIRKMIEAVDMTEIWGEGCRYTVDAAMFEGLMVVKVEQLTEEAFDALEVAIKEIQGEGEPVVH